MNEYKYYLIKEKDLKCAIKAKEQEVYLLNIYIQNKLNFSH